MELKIMSTEIIKCKKCGKRFKLEYLKYLCKMEDTRNWDTNYLCPYCNDVTNVRLSSDEDVKTSKLEFA